MGLFSSVAGIADSLTGGWLSDSGSKSSAKRQYEYNERLQDQNQDFQKYMAENAHQMEMEDLKRAGLNPALTITGSSAGSIAGSSSAQGTSAGSPMADLSSIIQNINNTKATNANNAFLDAQTLKTLTENEQLPKNLKNDTIRALAEKMNAETNITNAKTNRYNAKTNRGRAKWQNARDKSAIYTEKGGRIAKELGNWYWDI